MTNKGTIRFVYDAAGNKLRKTVTDNTSSPATTTTTDYINGFVYQNDTLQFFPTEEGRVRYVPAHGTTAAAYVYDYFIKDHLGNTRVVLTEQTDFSQYMATMETQNATTEDALFANVESTREAKPIDYPQDETTTPNTAVAKLNGSDPDKRVGPSIILKVMAGDTIQAAVRAFYRQQATTQNNAGVPAEDMAVSLMQALSLPMQAAASTHEVSPQSRLAAPQGGITSSDLNDLKEKDPNTQREDKPKAYLNYVFFDNQFNFVEDGSGVKQVDSDPNQLETLSSGQVVAKKTGYVFVYTSNESQQDVLFDNMSVTQITGPVLEETHYYPFGLTMAGISSTAPLKIENKFKFQGQELQHKEFSDGSGLETYQFKFRMDDPQIGRFWQIDPLASKYVYNSPYAFSENKVTGHVELEGLESIPINPIGELWKSTGITGATDPKQFMKDLGKEALKPNNVGRGVFMTAAIAVPIMATELMTDGVGGLTILNTEAKAINLSSLSTETSEIGLTEKTGVDLVIKGKANWNPSQNAEAFSKAEALTNDPATVVTKSPVAREANLRTKFIKAGGQLSEDQQVDHIRDLQLGGTNDLSNLKGLNGSVNASFGKQIQLQIKNLPDATRVNKVTFIPEIKETQ